MAGDPPISPPANTVPSEWLLAAVKVIESQHATLFGEGYMDVSQPAGRLKAGEWLSSLVLEVVAERDKILLAYEQERLRQSRGQFQDGIGGNNGNGT